jgi:predicted transposase YdaD
LDRQASPAFFFHHLSPELACKEVCFLSKGQQKKEDTCYREGLEERMKGRKGGRKEGRKKGRS